MDLDPSEFQFSVAGNPPHQKHEPDVEENKINHQISLREGKPTAILQKQVKGWISYQLVNWETVSM